jgi:hypothetical protein
LISIIVIIPPIDGMMVRLTISNGRHSPALLTAMMTPDTGEIARPIPAINCMGRTMVTALTPKFVAMPGARPENAKKAATPEPAIIAVTPANLSSESTVADLFLITPDGRSAKYEKTGDYVDMRGSI